LSGEHLDLVSDAPPSLEANSPARPFVGIHFQCCDIYTRVYINRDSTAYLGHCPRCGRAVRLRIGPGGTSERFFTAY
jgi:hypothetical protein